ncbi:MAG: hypothetical protein IJ690_02795 [Clostridia bacterium]|nr:hypothetical protein [Clostridia bacterium]
MLKKNKIMKLIVILIVMVMSMCVLSGCGDDNKESDTKSNQKNDTEIVKDNDSDEDDNEEADADLIQYINDKKNELSGDSDVDRPVKNMVEGLVEANSSKFIQAFPPFLSTYMDDFFDDETLKSAVESATSEYGDNIKMSYEVISQKEIEQSKLEEMEKELKESYNQTVDITKGYELEVKITTKGDKAEDSETDSFEVYQIDGTYYILNM